MNSLHIIGRLTNDPELRTTTSGKDVCSFDVAVNRKKTKKAEKPETDYFKVSVWNELGKICQQYLEKGRMVSVVGPVSARAYTNSKGEAKASLEVNAVDVEFLSPKGEIRDQESGYVRVNPDDLPY